MRRTVCRIACMLAAWALAATPHAAQARGGEVLRARVIHVTDGDTLWVRTDEAVPRRLKLRLASIDAPEICQRHGKTARAALHERVTDRRVIVRTRAMDAHGRLVAQLRDRSGDVAAWLVREGHAWSGSGGRGGPYRAEEQAARAERRGLFVQASPQPPWKFRQRHGSCYP